MASVTDGEFTLNSSEIWCGDDDPAPRCAGMDLSRFDTAPLIALTAKKEMKYMTERTVEFRKYAAMAGIVAAS